MDDSDLKFDGSRRVENISSVFKGHMVPELFSLNFFSDYLNKALPYHSIVKT